MQDALAMDIDLPDLVVDGDGGGSGCGDERDYIVKPDYLDNLSTDTGEESRYSMIDKPWMSEKCVSCCTGFNMRSSAPITCAGCDSYTHKKQACVEECHGIFYCTSCFPTNGIKKTLDKDKDNGHDYSRVENGFKCEICGVVIRTKFSIRRHLIRRHNKHQYIPEKQEKNDPKDGNDDIALPKFWFRQGRMKDGGDRPTPGKQYFLLSNFLFKTFTGILAVDDEYEFIAHKLSKGGEWSYHCKYYSTPTIMCPARAKVGLCDNIWSLLRADKTHRCSPNKARVAAHNLRRRMRNMVRENDNLSCGKIVKIIRSEAKTEFGKDQVFYNELLAELGPDSALEKQLLRVRKEVLVKKEQVETEFSADLLQMDLDDVQFETNLDKETLSELIENSQLNPKSVNGEQFQEFADPFTQEPPIKDHKSMKKQRENILGVSWKVKNRAWISEKCSSCSSGFNMRSSEPLRCDGCGFYIHRKQACVIHSGGGYYCGACVPRDKPQDKVRQESELRISKLENGFQCKQCGFVTKTKFSVMRHLKRKHDGTKTCSHFFNDKSTNFDDENQSRNSLLQKDKNDGVETGNEADTSYSKPEFLNTSQVGNEDTSLAELLTENGLREYLQVFSTQKIDLEMLLNLEPDDFSEMFRDIGITPWGHRFKLRKALDVLKNKTKSS